MPNDTKQVRLYANRNPSSLQACIIFDGRIVSCFKIKRDERVTFRYFLFNIFVFVFRVPAVTAPEMTAARASSPWSRPRAEAAATQRPASTPAEPPTQIPTRQQQIRHSTQFIPSENTLTRCGVTAWASHRHPSVTWAACRQSGAWAPLHSVRATIRPRPRWARWSARRTVSVLSTFRR